MIILNVFCIGFSWWVASLFPRLSISWWLNIIASAANGAYVLAYVVNRLL